MTQVRDVYWRVGSNTVRWDFGGSAIAVEYKQAVRSVVPLLDGSGVALVEPIVSSDQSNAVILNADGSLRFRLPLPIRDGSVYGFDQMYYVRGELTAILAVTGRDLAYVVDENDGAYLRCYETR